MGVKSMTITQKLLFPVIFLALLGITMAKPLKAQAVDLDKLSRQVKARVSASSILNKFSSVKLINAEVTAINGTTLTVSKDGKTYTINTSNKTKFRRLFWGQSSLAEISVGNKINAWGKWTDDNKTTMDATMVRDLSIMKRFGVFFGTVKSKSDTNFVLTAVQRGDQTVFFDNNTKFVNRKQQTMGYGDMNVGDKIRVKGVWDKSNSKITEVSQIKDFSLPPQNSPSASSGPSPSTNSGPSPSPSPQ